MGLDEPFQTIFQFQEGSRVVAGGGIRVKSFVRRPLGLLDAAAAQQVGGVPDRGLVLEDVFSHASRALRFGTGCGQQVRQQGLTPAIIEETLHFGKGVTDEVQGERHSRILQESGNVAK
jgi:hypothetical protein